MSLGLHNEWKEYFTPMAKAVERIWEQGKEPLVIYVTRKILDQLERMYHDIGLQGNHFDLTEFTSSFMDVPVCVGLHDSFDYEFTVVAMDGKDSIKGFLSPPRLEPQWIAEGSSEPKQAHEGVPIPTVFSDTIPVDACILFPSPKEFWRVTLAEGVYFQREFLKPPNWWFRLWQRLCFGWKWERIEQS